MRCTKRFCAFFHSNETKEQYMVRMDIKLKELKPAEVKEVKPSEVKAPRFFAAAPEKLDKSWAKVAAVETETKMETKMEAKKRVKRWDVKPDDVVEKTVEETSEKKTVVFRLPKDIPADVLAKMVAAVGSCNVTVEIF